MTFSIAFVVFSIFLMVSGLGAMSYGLYMLGIERGRQELEDEGGAPS